MKDHPNKIKLLEEGKFGPCPPFLIATSAKKLEVEPNTFIYGREYPWGVFNVESPEHSDFGILQNVLGGYIYMEAIQLTNNYYYKRYLERIKAKATKEKEHQTMLKNLGTGAICAVGLLGFAFLSK